MDVYWPFVGREVECADIRRALARPECGGVVLVGEPDVGRTRLAQETVTRLRVEGWHTEWVAAALALESVPFGAVIDLLPGTVRPDGHPAEVLRAAAARFAELGGRARVVICVDDADRIDRHSAALIAHLAARSLAFVVLTVRRGRPVPDPVGALWKDGVATRIEVSPLPSDAVDVLLGATLGGPVDAISRRRLHGTALGRPGVLRELLAGALEDGALQEHHGVWRWRAAAATARRVAELIATQLSRCDRGTREVLEAAASADALPLALLESIVDGTDIEAAERTGLLVVEADGARLRARLASPLYRTAIRAGMPVSRIRPLSAGLAEALAKTPMRRAEDPLWHATWQRDAGAVTAPAVLLPAARQAMDRDPALAEWCARAAVDAGLGDEARLVLAQLLARRGRRDESAAMLGGPPPEAGLREGWAAAQAAAYYWGAGQLDQAVTTIDKAACALGPDLADGLRSWLLVFDGAYVAGLDLAREVLSRPSCRNEASVWAAAAGCGAAGLLGLSDETARLRQRALRSVDALPEQGARPYVECVAGGALLCCGELATATTIAERGYEAAAADEAPLRLGLWALLRGMAARAAGRPLLAQRLLREATSLLSETATRLVPLCRAELAAAIALTGDAAGAAMWLAEPAPPSAVGPAVFPWRERVAAWLLAARGSMTDAVDRLCAAGGSASPMTEVHLLYDAARFGGAARVRDRLAELAGRIGGRLAPVLADAAAALSAGIEADAHTAGVLAAAADTLADLGYTLHAAELMTAAARVYRRLGRRARAMVCREIATSLAAQCEGAWTTLLAFGGADAPLTTREREIILLAGSNPSRAIAEHLGLAVSTVNNHLASAYAKLGITSRKELGELLRPDGTAHPHEDGLPGK